MTSFAEHLFRRLEAARFADYHDNYDELRFGLRRIDCDSWGQWQVRRVLRALGFHRQSWLARPNPEALRQWMDLIPDLEWLTDRLGDDTSRALLVDLIAYRIMGHRAVKLPLSTQAFRARLRELDLMGDSSDSIDIGFMGWAVKRYELTSLGYPISAYLLNPMTTFEAEQYADHTTGICVRDGDVVLDGGACYGDTALYFAHKAGPRGRVYSFEFVPGSLSILRRNLELNPVLASRIDVVEHALWKTSGVALNVSGSGPGTSVSSESSPACHARAMTVAIDDYVARERIQRVDFIKLDIEGAETDALLGGKRTIQSMHPKMAVCIYHSARDFVSVPRVLDKFCPTYRFYIRHFSMHAEETVLFAADETERQ